MQLVPQGVVVLHDSAELSTDQLRGREQQHGPVDPTLIRVDERGGLIEIRHQERQLIDEKQVGEGSTKRSNEMNWDPFDEVRTTLSLVSDSEGIAKPGITKAHEQLALGTSDGG